MLWWLAKSLVHEVDTLQFRQQSCVSRFFGKSVLNESGYTSITCFSHPLQMLPTSARTSGYLKTRYSTGIKTGTRVPVPSTVLTVISRMQFWCRPVRYFCRTAYCCCSFLSNILNICNVLVFFMYKFYFLSFYFNNKHAVRTLNSEYWIVTYSETSLSRTPPRWAASKPTLHTSSSLTFLTRLIFRTVSWQWLTKPNF